MARRVCPQIEVIVIGWSTDNERRKPGLIMSLVYAHPGGYMQPETKQPIAAPAMPTTASSSLEGPVKNSAQKPAQNWPLWACFIAALVPVLAICVLQMPRFAMNPDDFVQALFAKGDFLAASSEGLMPYTLVLVSKPLSWLYALAPGVAWYTVLLLVLIVCSFAVVGARVGAAKVTPVMKVSLAIILLAFEVLTTLYLTYTIVAFLAVAAGLVILLSEAAFTKPPRATVGDIGAYILIAVGFSLRPESGAAVFVIFAPFMFWVLVRNHHVGSFVRAILAVGLVAVCYVGGQYAYNHTAGWESYTAYLDAGRSVLDYPQATTDDVRSAVSTLSENDVAMLYDWDFIDEEVFNTEVFEQISEVVPRFTVSNFLSSFTAKTTYLLLGLCVAEIVLVLLIEKSRKKAGTHTSGMAVLLGGICAMLLASYFIIIMRARPRLHVVIPLATITVFAFVVAALAPGKKHGRHMGDTQAFMQIDSDDSDERRVARHAKRVQKRQEDKDRSRMGRKLLLAPACVTLGCAVVIGGFWYTTIQPIQAHLEAPIVGHMQNYVDSHPDEIILFGHTQSALFGYDAFAFNDWDCPENVIFMGGWESHTSSWYEALDRMGLDEDSVLQQLVERDDMVAILSPSVAQLLQTYLAEHCGGSVTLTEVENLGPGVVDTTTDISVWKFELQKTTVTSNTAPATAATSNTVSADASTDAAQASETAQ